jgi:hypothetical protein
MARKDEAVEYLRQFSNICMEVLQDNPSLHEVSNFQIMNYFSARYMDI